MRQNGSPPPTPQAPAPVPDRQGPGPTGPSCSEAIYIDDYCPMESSFIAEDGVRLEFGGANATAEVTFSDDALLQLGALLDEIVNKMLRKRNILSPGTNVLDAAGVAATAEGGC